MKKFLIIRFSSIGDVVLTTPIVRCLKKKYPKAEIHFLTRKFNNQFLSLNPNIDKLHLFHDNLPELITELKKEKFDFVIDLQRNIRSMRVKIALKRPSKSFSKLNIRKWILVHTKKDYMPKISVVDRYFEAVKPLQVDNDGLGLDFFLKEEKVELPNSFSRPFVAIACGAQHGTKQIPPEKIEFLLKQIQKPIVLLGDEKDNKRISFAINFSELPHVFNACGRFSLNASALVLQKSALVITSDTGLMHISAALQKNNISLWGNTVPEFGMYPYLPKEKEKCSIIMEVRGLKCRPCSKLGFKECPKGHFNCMQKIDYQRIIEIANAISER